MRKVGGEERPIFVRATLKNDRVRETTEEGGEGREGVELGKNRDK